MKCISCPYCGKTDCDYNEEADILGYQFVLMVI